MTYKSDVGWLAEDVAANYLEGKGYKILDRNYWKPWGEIDIIAEKESVVIFCEVKANAHPGSNFDPSLRADYEKLNKVIRSARIYLSNKKYGDDQPWQVDLVTVVFDKASEKAKITHFKNITEL